MGWETFKNIKNNIVLLMITYLIRDENPAKRVIK
jgi:hypothetical protein